MVGFYTTCFDLAKNVMECLAAIGGLPADFFVRAHSGENVTLRLLYYPEGEATGEVVAGAHTDYGLLTLLFQDDVDGLQVESKPGYWLDVDSAVDAVVLNTGDLMAHWSNDRFPSTRHRVCRRSSKARLSIAFFCDPDAETLVEVQPGFMADGDTCGMPRPPLVNTFKQSCWLRITLRKLPTAKISWSLLPSSSEKLSKYPLVRANSH